MITNERQHRIARTEIKRFEEAIADAEGNAPPDVHPRLNEAMIDGFRSQLDELREEVDQYEALRAGKVRQRPLTSLRDLPDALIEGRIVRRLTQKELGKKLRIPEQQVQRYERTRYAGVSLERINEVAEAIGLQLGKTVEFQVPAAASGGGASRRRSRSRTTGKKLASAAGKTASTSVGKRASRQKGG
jgi:transcriptional regulator with XRE-family HTH domain